MKSYYFGDTLRKLDELVGLGGDLLVESFDNISPLRDNRFNVEVPHGLPERFFRRISKNGFFPNRPFDPEDMELLRQQADLIRATIQLLR